MNFEPTITLSALLTCGVTIVLATLGAIAGYVTLRAKVMEVEGKSKDTAAAVSAYGTALADLRNHVAENCVKKDDLERVEDRITSKLDKVEHSIRNALMEILRVGRRPSKED